MAALRVVGVSHPRIDGPDKVAGRTRYVADLKLPGMVYARLVLSRHAHARIRRIDAGAARRLPGVLAVLTDGDLGGRGLLAAGEVYYAGQPVAVVVADDPALAADAAEAVDVDYEPLPAVVDPLAALQPGAPQVRPHAGGVAADAGAHAAEAAAQQEGERPANCSHLVRYRRGDVEQGFREADVIIDDTYRIASVHQGYLEPQGCVAEVGPDGRLTIWSSTQGHFFAQQETAQLLGIPESRIRVVPMPVGGGFGGKILLLEPLAAALALAVGRPVQLVLTRYEDFLTTRPGPAAIISIRLGARRDGRLTALQARLVFNVGADPEEGAAAIASLLLGSTYRVPHLDVTGLDVLTHTRPTGAYRAPGAPQAYFALESHLDRLARRLGLDPVELRLRHAVREGDERADGRPWPRIGLVECLERLREHPLWRERPRGEDEGWGVAVGGWPGGVEPAAAACRVNRDGTVTVHVGAVDLTGSHTSFALIAAEVLGLPPERVHVVSGDTDAAPYAGMSAGSKTLYTVGRAVHAAAEEVRRQVLAMASELLEAAPEDLELAEGRVQVRGAPARALELAELARRSTRFGSRFAPLYGQGRVALDRSSPGFAVHLAQVRVDRATGHVRPLRYLAVQDVGRAINPAEVRGQIHGGVVQGIGRALCEQLAYDESGQPLTAGFGDYLIPNAGQVPAIEVELVEVPSPHGPFGAKGVGEPPVVPCAAALANAVEDAVGVRVTRLPMTPEAVYRALRGG